MYSPLCLGKEYPVRSGEEYHVGRAAGAEPTPCTCPRRSELNDAPEYDQMTEEDLLVALATELYGQKVESFGPSDARRLMEDAREWLQRWLSRKRQDICQELARRGFQSSTRI